MAKLQVKDLTPELLAEMKDLSTGKEVKDFLASKDLEISDSSAELIASQLNEGVQELTEEQLEAVSGGCGSGRYGGSEVVPDDVDALAKNKRPKKK